MSDRPLAEPTITTAASDAVVARAIAPPPDMPLTPVEQTARLQALAGPEMARKLFPAIADSTATRIPWEPGLHRALPHGLNGPTRLTTDAQGTALWQRRTDAAATGASQIDPMPSDLAPNGGRAPRRSQGQTVADVVARVTSDWDAHRPASAAWSILDDSAWTEQYRSPFEPDTNSIPPFLQDASDESLVEAPGFDISHALPLFDVFGAVLSFREFDRQARKALSMRADPTLSGSALPYIQAGVVFAGGATTVTASMGALHSLNIVDLSDWEGLAQFTEVARAPVVLAGEILHMAIAAHEYRSGRISWRDFSHRIAGVGILVTCVAGGVTLGAGVDFLAGGTTGGAGTQIGARIGILAAPAVVHSALSQPKLSEQQRLRVNEKIAGHYGLENDHSAGR